MEYTIQIKQNPQSGWFIGQCEEIPEAITQGKDMDELMFMMQDAIELALECRRDEFRQQYADETVKRPPYLDTQTLTNILPLIFANN